MAKLRFIVARYGGRCASCHAALRRGDTIAWDGKRAFCRPCAAGGEPCAECGGLEHTTWCSRSGGPGAEMWNRWSLVEKVEWMVEQRRAASR